MFSGLHDGDCKIVVNELLPRERERVLSMAMVNELLPRERDRPTLMGIGVKRKQNIQNVSLPK